MQDTRLGSDGFAVSGSRGRVLVVDDQPLNIRLVTLLLETSGFTVIPALSGAEGIAMAATMSPDVVLLDMRMPGMDGFEVLDYFQSDPSLLVLPVIFLTADNDRETLVRAFSAGVVDFVTKPFITQELVSRVRTQVELGRAREALRRLGQERGDGAWFAETELGCVLTDIRRAAELQLHQSASTPELARLAQAIRGSADAAIGLVRAAQERHDAASADESVELPETVADHSGS